MATTGKFNGTLLNVYTDDVRLLGARPPLNYP
jgi:hypothetical protein